MINLPGCRQPFETREFWKAIQYLQDRVEDGDFDPRSWPARSEERGDLRQVAPEAPAVAMREVHESAQDQEGFGVFG